MDRYTPCISRPTEAHARRRKNVDHRKTGYHETVLHHFSVFLDHQESRITQLMRTFDIDFENDASLDRVGITDLDTSAISGAFDNIAPSSSPELSPAPQPEKPPSIQPSSQASRPGRLSPSTIRMILAPNISTVSGISSTADTSYDSGLYQWLSEMGPCAPRSSSIPATFNEPIDDNSNLDVSITSSHNAYYSHPSQESRMILPLSPPTTALPPFSSTLQGEPTRDSPLCHLASKESHQIYDFHDLTTSKLSNNSSLQHYMPSAAVLRNFQDVINELRGLYVPYDARNNAPNPDRIQTFLSPPRSLPGSYTMSLFPASPCRASHNPSDSVTEAQSNTIHAAPAMKKNNIYKDSRTTRELYNEMAVMLFAQVSNEEVQVTNLRNLVSRLEVLTRRKRKVALVIGTWGREVEGR